MTDLNWSFQGGKLVQDVQSITLVNNTAKTQDTTVPSGKRWLLLSIKAMNPDNVTRDVTIDLYKEAAKTNAIARLESFTIPTLLRLQWPNGRVSVWNGATVDSMYAMMPLPHLVILEAGNTISIYWAAGGASAGATDADGLVICYLEVDA